MRTDKARSRGQAETAPVEFRAKEGFKNAREHLRRHTLAVVGERYLNITLLPA